MFLGQMEMALAMYRQDYDEYPPGGPTGLSRLGKPGKRGAYYEFRESQLDPELRVLDPWRHPYVYRVHRREGKADRVELYSVGPNGIDEAGKGDDVTP